MSFIAVGAGAGYLLGGSALATGLGAVAGGALAGSLGGSNNVNAPQANPQQIGSDSLATQLQLAPQVLAASQLYGPQYTQLQLQQQQQALLGNFDPGAFEAEHPGFLQSFNDQQAAGQLQGWTPAQFAAAYTGKPANDPSLTKYYSGGTLGLYNQAQPALSNLNATANTAQRTADINDVLALGPQARAAYLAANPQLAGAMSALDSHVASARNVTPTTLTSSYNPNGVPGPTAAHAGDPGTLSATYANAPRPYAASIVGRSPIQQTLEQQALAQLNLNGQLSPEDLRQAQQTARGAAEARGIYDSNSALSAEVLNTAAMKRQRQQEAQSFASGVDQQGSNVAMFDAGQRNNVAGQIYGTKANINLANAGAANNAAATTYGTRNQVNMFNAGQDNTLASQVYGQQNQNAQFGASQDAQRQLNQSQLNTQAQNDQFTHELQLAGAYQSQATDPFSVVLGRSGVPGQAAGAVAQGGAAAGAGPTLFDPFNPAITSIYAGNQANSLAAQVANAKNQSALTGSLLSAGSSLGAAYLMCWVARAAFGPTNPRWLAAQRWMVMRAPRGLFLLYANKGEKLAGQLVADGRRDFFRSLFRRLVRDDARAIAELTTELNAA
jgi:hypothetical protein